MQLSRDGPRQILSTETWPTKGQDTLKLCESLFMFRRQIPHTYTTVVWGFYIHCEKQAHIVHIEEPLLYASVMRLMWSHDTGWCQVRCSGCWLHGGGGASPGIIRGDKETGPRHYPGELTTTPGLGINLNIDIRCIDSSGIYPFSSLLKCKTICWF